MKPWRAVQGQPILREGRGSVLGPDTSRRTKWWVLTLECGHRVERVVKYKPAAGFTRGGTSHRSRDDVLPAPRKVRCRNCR